MKRKSVFAIVLMIIMICIAPFWGTAESLDDLRDDCISELYNDSNGFSIDTAADTIYDSANNLITIAEKYTDTHPSLSYKIDELKIAMTSLYNTYSDARIPAAKAVVQPAEDLTEALKSISLEETDAKYPDMLLSEIKSQQDIIKRSSYNDSAREFNKIKNSFPASLFSVMSEIKALKVAE